LFRPLHIFTANPVTLQARTSGYRAPETTTKSQFQLHREMRKVMAKQLESKSLNDILTPVITADVHPVPNVAKFVKANLHLFAGMSRSSGQLRRQI
jgi:hypothetical protein